MCEEFIEITVEQMLKSAREWEQKNDFEKAVYWYELAEKNGSAEAKRWLDDWYYEDGANTEAHS